MENPAHDIANVIQVLTTAVSPEIQKAVFQRFVTSDASYRHPLCKVDSGVKSRDAIQGIYQWYRIMSPDVTVRVDNIVYDSRQGLLVLDVVQTLHIRFFPMNLLTPTPSRLLVRIRLRSENNLHYICSQEDFYHPDDFASLLMPPLVPFVRFALDSASTISNLNARMSAIVMGLWAVGNGEANMDKGE